MGKRDGFYKRGRFWWCATDPITKRPKSSKCTDLVAAKAWKAGRERALHNPSHERASKATFGEWAAKLIAMKSQIIKPISVRAYSQFFGHWVRLIPESTILSEIGPGTFDDFISMRRADGVTDYMIGKEMTGLKTMLRLAKRSRCYPGDLDGLVPIDFKARHRKGTRALTPEEFVRLMAKLTPDQQAFVCVCIALGCRKFEAFQVQEIRGETVFIAGTKTDGSRRTVPVLSVFRKLLDHAAPLVPLPKSTSWNIGRNLWNACDAAGIPRCCPNDLRRTHASWLKEMGVDSDTVRRLLGHTSSALVDTVYGRPRPEKLAELAERAIALAPQGHDIPALPAARRANVPWKNDVTKGALGLIAEGENVANSEKYADESGSKTDENRQNRVATDTRTLQSEPPAEESFTAPALALALAAERVLLRAVRVVQGRRLRRSRDAS
jgi:integrase